MKTTLDQSDAIYRLLNVPGVTSAISGKVYSDDRPLDSDLEDVVIKSMTLADGMRQFGVALVNIHVKDIELSGVPGKLANKTRLKAISRVIVPLIEETDGEDFALWVESSSTIPEPEVDQHFLQLRLEVRMYNFN